MFNLSDGIYSRQSIVRVIDSPRYSHFHRVNIPVIYLRRFFERQTLKRYSSFTLNKLWSKTMDILQSIPIEEWNVLKNFLKRDWPAYAYVSFQITVQNSNHSR